MVSLFIGNSESLAAKSVIKWWHTLIDMNPVELKYSPFMTSFNKCT